jgi:hypothetical protein
VDEMSQLLNSFRETPDCTVKSPQGLPIIAHDHVLPDDIVEFYTLCGGISLFGSSAYSLEIVPPSQFSLANPIIFIGVNDDQLNAARNDISWSWYIVGKGENRQFITIDLNGNRLGRCYDSFWDCHAMPGYSPIIAGSFSEFLHRMRLNNGRHWYWLQPEFHSIGDAYG